MIRLGYQKHRKITSLLSGRQRAIVRVLIVGEVEFFFEKALAIAGRDWFLPVNAEHLGYIVPVQFKVGNYS
jgi:hypothetical protein